jgi:tetratricopeptide (TPR) repeat protein
VASSIRSGISAQAVILVAAWLLIAAPAFAAPSAGAKKGKAPPVEDAATTEAKVIYKRGEVAFKLGRFEEALAEFSHAYETKPVPAFLFNIAQCQFNLKNYERAVFFFEGFLRDALNNAQSQAQVQTANERLKEAKDALAAQKAEDDRKRAEQEKLEREEKERERERAERESQPRQIASAPVGDVRPTEPPPVASTPVYKQWWLWTIVGVVVGGGGAGVTAYVLTRPLAPVDPAGTLGSVHL